MYIDDGAIVATSTTHTSATHQVAEGFELATKLLRSGLQAPIIFHFLSQPYPLFLLLPMASYLLQSSLISLTHSLISILYMGYAYTVSRTKGLKPIDP
jgi:hypothetical protein